MVKLTFLACLAVLVVGIVIWFAAVTIDEVGNLDAVDDVDAQTEAMSPATREPESAVQPKRGRQASPESELRQSYIEGIARCRDIKDGEGRATC